MARAKVGDVAKPRWEVRYTLVDGTVGKLGYFRGATKEEAIKDAEQHIALEYFRGATLKAVKPNYRRAA